MSFRESQAKRQRAQKIGKRLSALATAVSKSPPSRPPPIVKRSSVRWPNSMRKAVIQSTPDQSPSC